MQGVLFWVQKGVNGSEHLFRSVLIIIKSLWGVGGSALCMAAETSPHTVDLWWCASVWLLGHIPTAWQIAYCIWMEDVILQRVFFFFLFCRAIRNDCCITTRLPVAVLLPWGCRASVTTSPSLQSINTFCWDWCFSGSHIFTVWLYIYHSLCNRHSTLSVTVVVMSNSSPTLWYQAQVCHVKEIWACLKEKLIK